MNSKVSKLFVVPRPGNEDIRILSVRDIRSSISLERNPAVRRIAH